MQMYNLQIVVNKLSIDCIFSYVSHFDMFYLTKIHFACDMKEA